MNVLKSLVYDVDRRKYVGFPLKDAVLLFVLLIAGLVGWVWLISLIWRAL